MTRALLCGLLLAGAAATSRAGELDKEATTPTPSPLTVTPAAKAGTALPWAPVLTLCEWVVAQPRTAADVTDTWDYDPHWGWARKQVAELLSPGFDGGNAEIPEAERPRVWAILEVLAQDPDPTASHEDQFGGDNMDALTLSINTTRGEALHAVVRYAHWRERALNSRGEFHGLRSLPEVAQLLEQYSVQRDLGHG